MTSYKRIIIGVAAAFGAGCGDSDTTKTPGDELGTVQGRLVTASGSAESASVVAVDDEGQATLVASGAIAADGTFRIEDVEPGDGPFIVRAEGGGSVIGEVILPGDIEAGETSTTMAIDQETTVEAEALVGLLAGTADRATVDTVGLMTWISAELAAEASGAASLGAAFWSAQEGWLAVTGTTAAEVEAAKLDVWAELSATVHASGSMSADAWHDFVQASQAELEATLDVAFQTQADAQAAAAILFEAALTGDAEARDGAARIGAELSAHAAWAAQLAAAEGSSAEGAISARLDAAYARFFDLVEGAPDRDAMGEAWGSLSAAISGHGSGDGATSALELLVTAEGGGEATSEDVEAAIASTVSLRTELEASIDAALSGSADARAEAVAQAWTTFRADVAAAVAAELGAEASARLESFVTEAAAQLSGHLSIVFDVDLIGELEVGVSIVGDIAADIEAALDGAVATLLSIDASGAVHAVATGTISAGEYHFEGVTAIGGELVVELADASGDIVGAVHLDAIAEASGTVTGATITGETTVEAEVLLERVADGERPSTIEMTWVELFVDGAVSAAADGDAALEALVTATIAAEAVMEDAMAGANESSARAHAEAAVAFGLAIDMATDAGAELEAAAQARARIEAALALEAGVTAVAEGTSFASYDDAIEARVDAFIGVMTQGSSQVEADAAASAFVDAMLGFSSAASSESGLLGDLAAELGLDVVAQGTIQTAITTSFAAAATFETAVGAAFEGASSGSGGFDGEGFAAAWSQARVTLDAALDVALALSSVTLSSGDREAMATLVTHLAIGFHGDFDGTFVAAE